MSGCRTVSTLDALCMLPSPFDSKVPPVVCNYCCAWLASLDVVSSQLAPGKERFLIPTLRSTLFFTLAIIRVKVKNSVKNSHFIIIVDSPSRLEDYSDVKPPANTSDILTHLCYFQCHILKELHVQLATTDGLSTQQGYITHS